MSNEPGIEKIATALKAAGVVIPLDLGLPGRVSAELSKQGITVVPNLGGLALTHYVLIWRD